MTWWWAASVLSVASTVPLLAHALLQRDLLRATRALPVMTARPSSMPLAPVPLVLVQLPVYNEPAVIHRLLEACVRLDHAPGTLVIQVLDDSTDVTTGLIELWLRRPNRGPRVDHVRRPSRDGFKAGALEHGLALVPEAEFVLVLDADFLPPPDLLRRALPLLLEDPELAGVQTSWSHLNRDESWLTRAQAAMLDAHFVIEQGGRSAIGGFMAFNGSGGLLRVSAIHDVGGWNLHTLTEDFDLSIRLQLAGHRLVLLPEVRSPAELPVTLNALRAQQHRWMRGVAQTSRAFLLKAWQHPMTPRRRLHLLGQLLEPSAFLAWAAQLLLAPVMAWGFATGQVPGVVAANVPLALAFFLLLPVYGEAWRRTPPQERGANGRLRTYAEFLLLSGAMAFANAVTVMAGWFGGEADFVRTPKAGRPGESPWVAEPDESEVGPGWPRRSVAEGCLVAMAATGAVLVLLWHPSGAFALWPQVTGWAGLAAFAWTVRPKLLRSVRRSAPQGTFGNPEGAV